MRKKNDRVILPLAIPKSCDFFFFFWTDQCWLPSNTHTKKRREREEKKKRGKHRYVLINLSLFFKKIHGFHTNIIIIIIFKFYATLKEGQLHYQK